MNVIFLTLSSIDNIEERGIYHDLMRKFKDEGHQVYIVSPRERRCGVETQLTESNGVKILNVRTLNIQKTNVVEKGIGTLLIERQFINAIKKYLDGVSFDLITYSTPPITFTNVVKYLKKRNPHAISYLQLKDIFPQNAVDLGLFGKRSLFNWFFRKKEKALYRASDFIGCMSPANVDYLLEHNPEIDASKVEVAPNSIELQMELSSSDEKYKNQTERDYIRDKYHLPKDKPILIYGGNLGKPQGISYLIECLSENKDRDDCCFVVVGTGTEFVRIMLWYEKQKPRNVFVMKGLPKDDYDMLVRSCDIGLIFLDYRFTIPNYPSRLLPYLMEKKPILAATDVNTDIGRIAEENGYGYWCPSNSVEAFSEALDRMLHSDLTSMGEAGYRFFQENYTVEHTYNAIVKHISQ